MMEFINPLAAPMKPSNSLPLILSIGSGTVLFIFGLFCWTSLQQSNGNIKFQGPAGIRLDASFTRPERSAQQKGPTSPKRRTAKDLPKLPPPEKKNSQAMFNPKKEVNRPDCPP
jgi:hypothetical protein